MGESEAMDDDDYDFKSSPYKKIESLRTSQAFSFAFF